MRALNGRKGQKALYGISDFVKLNTDTIQERWKIINSSTLISSMFSAKKTIHNFLGKDVHDQFPWLNGNFD